MFLTYSRMSNFSSSFFFFFFRSIDVFDVYCRSIFVFLLSRTCIDGQTGVKLLLRWSVTLIVLICPYMLQGRG